MEYTVSQLAKLSGVSPRTLRYYDQIDLLNPDGYTEAGYRLYQAEQVNRLQQILFFKAMGVPLEDIGNILDQPDFDHLEALEHHHRQLLNKRNQIDKLIQTITLTMEALKGGTKMSDQAKFEAFKESQIQENEEQYGQELHEKYGEETIYQSYEKMKKMTKAEHERAQKLGIIINEKLKESYHTTEEVGHLNTPIAKEIFQLHKEWIEFYWPVYTAEAHKGLGTMYVEDERFKAYYDKEQDGLAAHLRDIIDKYAE
jgi:DNA-binding transcriptional MerR regulator